MKHWLAIVFFGIMSIAHAQQDSVVSKAKKRAVYFAIGAGYTQQTVRDRGISPLLYKGDHFSVIGDIQLRSTKGEHTLIGRFDYGFMEAPKNGAEMTGYRGDGAYRYLYNLDGGLFRNRVQFAAGGALQGNWNLRYHQGYSNNAYNNEFYLSLAPAGRVQFPFKLFRQQFNLQYTAHLPISSFVVRPGLTGTYFEGFTKDKKEGIEGAIASGYMASWGTYFRYNSDFNLLYTLKNGNAMKISYNWDFYRLKSDYNPIEAGYQTILYSIIYKF